MPLPRNTRNRSPHNKARTRKLRREKTLSEKKLWSYLEKKKLGFLFRTQFGIGIYSLDFYCPEVKVCIEVDGPHHKDRLVEDAARDEFLDGFGILTIRVPSLDLFDKDKEYQLLHKWLEIIERTCRERRRDSKLPEPPPPGLI